MEPLKMPAANTNHFFVYNPFCLLEPHDKYPSIWGAEYKDCTEVHHGWVDQVQEEAIPRADCHSG